MLNGDVGQNSFYLIFLFNLFQNLKQVKRFENKNTYIFEEALLLNYMKTKYFVVVVVVVKLLLIINEKQVNLIEWPLLFIDNINFKTALIIKLLEGFCIYPVLQMRKTTYV